MKRILSATVLLTAAFYLLRHFWFNKPIVENKLGYSIYEGNCTWLYLDKGPQYLNLSAYKYLNDLNGRIYFPQFGFNISYIYSPCSNYKFCPSQPPASIATFAGNNSCNDIVFFNDSNYGNPRYMNDSHWMMYYRGFNETWAAIINWHCDPHLASWQIRKGQATAMITNYTLFNFTFYSSSVCYNVSNITNTTTTTTTTSVPGGDCFWNIGNNILNLTRFKNQTIATFDKNNSNVIAAITPCENGLRCNGEMVMSYEYDFVKDKCDNYLAVWEQGMNEPRYDPSRREWQFVYTNGEKCGGFESVYSVYWMCDNRTINQAKIVSFAQTGTCSFEMHINSSNACPNKK